MKCKTEVSICSVWQTFTSSYGIINAWDNKRKTIYFQVQVVSTFSSVASQRLSAHWVSSDWMPMSSMLWSMYFWAVPPTAAISQPLSFAGRKAAVNIMCISHQRLSSKQLYILLIYKSNISPSAASWPWQSSQVCALSSSNWQVFFCFFKHVDV